MIRKKVLSIGSSSATLLVQDTESNGELRVLRRVGVSGWSEADVKASQSAYEEMRVARLRGCLPIHNVLVQNAFLSVITSFASEGDVATLIEDRLKAPLEEEMVLQWLCACALSLQEMHTHHLCFPGLTVDRLFIDHQHGGTAQVLLGVPLPLSVYMAQLPERRKNGVKVSLDYPPEMLVEPAGAYHPTLSDVWCLGRLGEVLLTAKGSTLGQRSTSARQLIASMMAGECAMRPSMENVAQSLTSLVGSVKLGSPIWPAAPKIDSAAASQATQSPPPPPMVAPPVQPTPRTHAAPATAPSDPPSSTTSSPPPEVSSTRPQPARQRVAPTSVRETAPVPAHVDGVRASPVPRLQISPHREHAPRPNYAPDDSWHQRAQHQFEQLQRLNASPQKSRESGQVSPHRNRPQSQQQLQQVGEQKSPSPHRSGGHVDNNTRLLNEMYAEQPELLRGVHVARHPHRTDYNAEEAHRAEMENARLMKHETAQRQQEMRKHFTEWQRQNNQRYTEGDNTMVMEVDGVVIVAPRASPLSLEVTQSGAALTSRTTSNNSDGFTSRGDAAPQNRGSAKRSPQFHSARTRTPQPTSPMRRPTPGNAQPKVNWSEGKAKTSSVANRTASTGRARPLVESGGATASQIPSKVNSPSFQNSRDTATLSALEWSVDGIRSSLRGLLRSRELYGEVMQEVALFGHQQEEARISVAGNEIFTQRLQKLLPDRRQFNSAVTLCAQLVALEGLHLTLRGDSGARASR